MTCELKNAIFHIILKEFYLTKPRHWNIKQLMCILHWFLGQRWKFSESPALSRTPPWPLGFHHRRQWRTSFGRSRCPWHSVYPWSQNWNQNNQITRLLPGVTTYAYFYHSIIVHDNFKWVNIIHISFNCYLSCHKDSNLKEYRQSSDYVQNISYSNNSNHYIVLLILI